MPSELLLRESRPPSVTLLAPCVTRPLRSLAICHRTDRAHKCAGRLDTAAPLAVLPLGGGLGAERWARALDAPQPTLATRRGGAAAGREFAAAGREGAAAGRAGAAAGCEGAAAGRRSLRGAAGRGGAACRPETPRELGSIRRLRRRSA